MPTLPRVFAFFAVLALAAPDQPRAPGATPAVAFFDSTFADADWAATVLTFNHPGASAARSAGGGNPGSHRTVTTFRANPGESRVVIVELRAGAVADPSALGGIAVIDYAEDQRCSSLDGCAGLGQGWAPALRQGGRFYIAQGSTTGVLEGWTSVSRHGLMEAEFTEVVMTATSDTDPSSHPDFSASGGTVELGYARTNRKNAPRTGRLDNWAVTVTGPGVPVERSSWGMLKDRYR